MPLYEKMLAMVDRLVDEGQIPADAITVIDFDDSIDTAAMTMERGYELIYNEKWASSLTDEQLAKSLMTMFRLREFSDPGDREIHEWNIAACIFLEYDMAAMPGDLPDEQSIAKGLAEAFDLSIAPGNTVDEIYETLRNSEELQEFWREDEFIEATTD